MSLDRCWIRSVLLVCALWVAAGTGSAAPLVLDESTSVIQAWPAVSMRVDPSMALTLQQVVSDPQRFVAPKSSYPTLGLQREAVWLRIPVEPTARATPDWILDIDYPALNRVEVYVLSRGRVLQQAVLGSQQPFGQRPLASRSHAVTIELPPGEPSELLLRVQTTGAMILPITLNTSRAFHDRAGRELLLQGLLAGLGLSLLVYSLGRWAMLRESLSLKYALLISGSMMFSLFQFGIGAQYLWRDGLWFERHAAGLFSLLALTGSFLFVEHVLARTMRPHLVGSAASGSGRYTSHYFSKLMKGGAALTIGLAILYALDVIDTRVVSAIVSLLGPVPALLGLPDAVALARKRDPVGWSFLLAWAIYALTTAVLICVINGLVTVNFWTLHSFQFGATIDMLVFMHVLSLGTKAVHRAAQHASQERDAMHSLAHSDPLTGLDNRRRLNTQLAAAVAQCAPSQLVALYLLDLDGFKPVNDQYGHDVGDQLLIAVARQLQSTTRSGDVVARLGGDEFVILTWGLDAPEQADSLAQKLLDAVNGSFQLDQHRCQISLTIGYALAPLDSTDPSDLLKRADMAMYAGKQAGKGCARRWTDGINAAPVP